MFRFKINDIAYLPITTEDKTRTFMSLEVTAYKVTEKDVSYQVNDLLSSWYKDNQLMTKPQIIQFLKGR